MYGANCRGTKMAILMVQWPRYARPYKFQHASETVGCLDATLSEALWLVYFAILFPWMGKIQF